MAVNVTADGNLTKDVELRFSQNGNSWAKFSIAVNESSGQGADKKEIVTFLECKIFGQEAENLAESAKKGSRLHVRGRLRNESWKDSSGEERRSTVVLIDEVYVSLKYATAQVTKTAKPQGQGDYQSRQSAPQAPPADAGDPFDDNPFV
jgi:single-strand DNA-binding protein